MEILSDLFRVVVIIEAGLVLAMAGQRFRAYGASPAARWRLAGLALVVLATFLTTVEHLGDEWVWGHPVNIIGLAVVLHGLHLRHEGDGTRKGRHRQ